MVTLAMAGVVIRRAIDKLRLASLITAIAAAAGLSLALPTESQADFSGCSVAAMDGGALLGPTSVQMTARVTTVIKFRCPGTTTTPELGNYGGTTVRVGSAIQEGDLWTFTLTYVGDQAESGQLRLGTQSTPPSQSLFVQLTIVVDPAIPPPSQPGGSPPPSGGSGHSCDAEAIGAVRGDLEARLPGSQEFVPVPTSEVCALLRPTRDISGDGSGKQGVGVRVEQPTAPGQVPWPYPEGTVFRVTGEIPGYRLIAAAAGVRNPRLQAQGDRFVLDGEAITGKVSTTASESGCAEAEIRTTFSGVILGEWAGSQYAGTAIGVNGYSGFTPPKITSGGFLEYSIAGCGDGNPATLEGFYDAQLGKAFLDSGGVTQPVLAAADDAAVQALFNVTNNGRASSATFRKAANPDGTIVVLSNYRLSFSVHTIGFKANKKATAFARKCTKAKGSKLRTKKQTIKVKKKRVKAAFLTCTPKKSRSSKLRVG